MFHFILFLIATGYLIYRLITDKSAPKGARVNWDAMDKDRVSGVPWEKRQKNFDDGKYWTTAPKKKPVEVIPKVVDIKRYMKDKEQLGESYAEKRRSYGEYMFIREI